MTIRLPCLWPLLGCLCLFALTGCNGCRPGPLVERNEEAPDIDELEKKKKEKEKPKEDFEFAPALIIPGKPDESRAFVKPGHWVTVRHLIKANNFDFQSDLVTRATDSMGVPFDIDNTQFYISSSRPAPLPKGQEKAFDTNFFVPVMKQTDDLNPKSVWLHRELRAARGGRLAKEDVRQGTVPMPLYQYHFLVLSDEPSRFGYLQSLTAFSAPTSSELDTDKLTYYRVHAPQIDRFAPLPNHFLTWTSLAYILWDDMDPAVLTAVQQQALIDWLHFGGQMIISGPNSLEKLKGSYLEEYLPAAAGSTVEIAQGAIDELNAVWSLRDARTQEFRSLRVPPDKPLLGVDLQPRQGATAVPQTGGLVTERRVGMGRICVTAFSLSDPRILNWGSLDSFVNATLLRRPRRRFDSRDLLPDTVFADYHPSLSKDSRMSSTLRLFSRDISVFSTTMDGRYQAVVAADDVYPGTDLAVLRASPTPTNIANLPVRPGVSDLHPDVDDWRLRGYWSGWRTSMAAWNDRSGAANAARQSLKDAAGISIPKGEFVLKVLAVYLAVLAPLNWLVFRLMGRVELAWLSAPVIAVIGTFAVVRLAQLDIGFARSRTEIGIIEAHGGYSRAHATRYSALYTSLSTSYDLEFEDDGALALPFASSDYERGIHDPAYEVTLRRDKQLRLSGFLVPSNKTGTIHCEQILDLGGAFSLNGSDSSGWQLQNGTTFPLRHAGVIRRTAAGNLEGAYIGDISAQSSAPLRFLALDGNRPHLAEWDDAPETRSYDTQIREILTRLDKDSDGKLSAREATGDPLIAAEFNRIDRSVGAPDRRWDRDELVRWCRTSRAGEVSLGQLYELASQALRLGLGEVRLIGWSDAPLPGVTVRPAAAQEAHRSLFLVHLRPGALPTPRPDSNLLSDVQEIKPENLEDPALPEAPVPEPSL